MDRPFLILPGGTLKPSALALTRVLESLLYGTSPTDPLTFGATTGLLLGVGVLASYLPARRASTVDPMEALRSE